MADDCDLFFSEGKQATGIITKIGYAEFAKIFRIDNPIENPKNWFPGLALQSDGIYVIKPEEYNGCFLTPEELSILTKHPNGNLSEPALSFPCSKKQIFEFIKFYGLDGCYDPEALKRVSDEPEMAKREIEAETDPAAVNAAPLTRQQVRANDIDPEEFIRNLRVSFSSDSSISLHASGIKVQEFSCDRIGFKSNSKGWKLLSELLHDKNQEFYVGIHSRKKDSSQNKEYQRRQKLLNHVSKKFIQFLNREFRVDIPSNVKLFENQKGLDRDGIYKAKFQIVDQYMIRRSKDVKKMSKDETLNEIKALIETRKRENDPERQDQILKLIITPASYALKNNWITEKEFREYISIPDEEIQPSDLDALSDAFVYLDGMNYSEHKNSEVEEDCE